MSTTSRGRDGTNLARENIYPCGCQHLDLARSWRLCAYHDGLNDGMAMREAQR